MGENLDRDPRGAHDRARVGWLAAALAAVAALLVGVSGCAERRSPDDIDLAAHTAAWNDPASAAFHGTRVAAEGTTTCVGCHSVHGAGTADMPSCNDCHVGASGHPGGYRAKGSGNFHGDDVAAVGTSPCRTCHGETYAGGWSGVACSQCHLPGPDNHPPAWSGHPDGWMTPASSLFHGLRASIDGVEDCTRCHGFGLGGGTSGVACADCHR